MGNKVSTFFPDFCIECMVVGGGDKNDPNGNDPSQQGDMRLWSPRYSKDVNLSDIQLGPTSQSPTQSSQQQFPGVLDPGTIVYVLKQAGDTFGVVLGMGNQMVSKSGSGGGQDVMNSDVMKDLKSRKIGVNTPPKVVKKKERGAMIRKIEEKGEEHSLDMLDGLPIGGALFEMTGFQLPALKNIPTAKQTNDGMVSNQMMQQMMGQVMSLGQMFQGLAKNGSGGGAGGAGGLGASSGLGLGNGPSYMDDIHSNIRKNLIYDPKSAEETITALNSLSKLVQGYEGGNDGGTVITGSVAHYTIYLENATQLLSQVTSVADIMYVLNRMQSDTSLHGLDKLEPVEYTIDTAHGTVTQRLWHDGELEIIMDANTMNNLNNWANTITSPESSPAAGSTPSSGSGSGSGAGAGAASSMQQMFGKSSKTMMDMFKRLTPKQEKEAKKMHEKLNQSDTAKKFNEIHKRVSGEQGGDPLSKDLYMKSQDSGGFGF